VNECHDQIVIGTTNIGGGAGKSTLCDQCFSPLMRKAITVSIEDWNSSQAHADLEISAHKFHTFAAQLNSDDDADYIVDIGASNARLMFDHFQILRSTLERFTHWIIPTRAGAKETLDTLKTAQLLLDLNVDASKITVVPNAITDLHSYEADFADIMHASQVSGFSVASQAVLHTPVLDLIRGSGRSVFDIVANKPDFKELRRAAKGDEKALMQVGHQMLVTDLAAAAARNYLAVFESLDIGRLIYGRG
jgi:hypothetical protein